MRKVFVLACVCFLALAQTIAAHGDVISYTVSLPAMYTCWTQTAVLPQFDPALGTLTSVEYEATARILGHALFESLCANPGCVNVDLVGDVKIQWPATQVVLALNPAATLFQPVGAYDGIWDYAGISGNTLAYVAEQTKTTQGPINVSLDSFIGTGSVLMPVTARASASVSGPGTLFAYVDTEAAADVTVKYNFLRVPEPSSALALCTALLGGVGVFVRRKRA